MTHTIEWRHVDEYTHSRELVFVSCRCGVRSRGPMSVTEAGDFTRRHRQNAIREPEVPWWRR